MTSQKMHHHALDETIAALRVENERLRAALTPSAETKADYMGEFSLQFPESDGDGGQRIRQINVPWTTIKKIMAHILKRATSPDAGSGSHNDG